MVNPHAVLMRAIESSPHYRAILTSGRDFAARWKTSGRQSASARQSRERVHPASESAHTRADFCSVNRSSQTRIANLLAAANLSTPPSVFRFRLPLLCNSYDRPIESTALPHGLAAYVIVIQEVTFMSLELWLGAAVALFVLIYLVAVLVRPERY